MTGYLVSKELKVQCLDAEHKMSIIECHVATHSICFQKNDDEWLQQTI